MFAMIQENGVVWQTQSGVLWKQRRDCVQQHVKHVTVSILGKVKWLL